MGHVMVGFRLIKRDAGLPSRLFCCLAEFSLCSSQTVSPFLTLTFYDGLLIQE